MGLFDDSAIPEHLDDLDEAKAAFKDDQVWYMRWRPYVKHWNAFGPRSPKGIAFSYLPPFILKRKWRDVPKVLWAERGPGYWRYESVSKEEPDLWSDHKDPRDFLKDHPTYFLSRNQYWCEWHKAILWPFFHSEHRYTDPKHVIPVGERAPRKGKLDMSYAGAKFDKDCYWYPAMFKGNTFK